MSGGRARRFVIVGCGNPDRGDDGAGMAVAAGVAERCPGRVEVVPFRGDALALLGALEGVAVAYVVDAVASGGTPGTIRRETLDGAPSGSSPTSSTHGLGIADALELARSLDRLPPLVHLRTIEGSAFGIGASISAPVAQAVKELVEAIADEVAAGSGDG